MVANTERVSTHASEVAKGERFTFGDNWSRFLSVLDERRIDEAVVSLKEKLEVDTLVGKTFLDIGSGSGLFSLAARKLGARVHSFDFDPQSVACTTELRRRYFPEDDGWRIEEASALYVFGKNGERLPAQAIRGFDALNQLFPLENKSGDK